MATFWELAKDWVPGAKKAAELKNKSPEADRERRKKSNKKKKDKENK